MKMVVATATDVATVAVGDPTLLTSLEACKGRDHEKVRAEAEAAGWLWSTDTGADGAYLFHLYVDEDPPPDVVPYLQDPIVVERFRVPSGRLRIAGLECFIGAISLETHPGMGGEASIQPDEYQLTAFRGELPDDVLESRFAERATATQRRAWSFGNRLVTVCVFATLAALVGGYFIYVRTTLPAWLSLLPLALSAAMWLGRRRFCRSAAYEEAERLYSAVQLEVPSVAVVLKRPGSSLQPVLERAHAGPLRPPESRWSPGDRILVAILVGVILSCIVATILAAMRIL